MPKTSIFFLAVSLGLNTAFVVLFPLAGGGIGIFVAFMTVAAVSVGFVIDMAKPWIGSWGIAVVQSLGSAFIAVEIVKLFPSDVYRKPIDEFPKGWNAFHLYDAITYDDVFQAGRAEFDRPLSIAAIHKFKSQLPDRAYLVRLWDHERVRVGCVVEMRHDEARSSCFSLHIQRDSSRRIILTGTISGAAIDTIEIDPQDPSYGGTGVGSDNVDVRLVSLRPKEGFDYLLSAALTLFKD